MLLLTPLTAPQVPAPLQVECLPLEAVDPRISLRATLAESTRSNHAVFLFLHCLLACLSIEGLVCHTGSPVFAL